MTNTPEGVYHLTPIDRGFYVPKNNFTPPDTNRYAFSKKSEVFDDRYSVLSLGYTPEFLPRTLESPLANEFPYNINDLFSSQCHESIPALLKLNAGVGKYSDYVYGDLSPHLLGKSLTPPFKDILDNLKYLNGTSAKRQALHSLQALLIRNEIKYFNGNYISNLAKFQKANVSDDYKGSDPAKNENIAIRSAKQDSAHLSPSENTKTESQMGFWRTLPGDINKKLIVYKADQTAHSCFISSDDTLHVDDTSKSSSKVPYEVGDNLVVNNKKVPLSSDVNKARTINSLDNAKIFNLLKASFMVDFKVVTSESDSIEANPSLSVARDTHIVLSLDPTTATDVTSQSPLLRKTEVTYNTNSTVNVDLAKVAFPQAILYVLNDDPILDYLIDKEQAVLTFTDFSLSFFSNYDELIFARKIPQHIIIVPTDKTEFVPFHAKSRMSVFGTRSLRFVYHPDERKQDNYLLNTDHLTYASDVYTLNTEYFSAERFYRGESESLPRKTSSVYKSLVIMRALILHYGTLPETTPLFELLFRLTPSELQSLRLDVDNFEDYLFKLRVQKLSSVASVAELYPKLGEVFYGGIKITPLTYTGAGSESYPILNQYKPLLSSSKLNFLKGYPK